MGQQPPPRQRGCGVGADEDEDEGKGCGMAKAAPSFRRAQPPPRRGGCCCGGGGGKDGGGGGVPRLQVQVQALRISAPGRPKVGARRRLSRMMSGAVQKSASFRHCFALLVFVATFLFLEAGLATTSRG